MRQFSTPIFTILLVLFGSRGIQAQEFLFEIDRFSTESGLSDARINSVVKTSSGYIWAGTYKGLNRFDGHQFKVFTAAEHGLCTDEIDLVLEDGEGWLWLIHKRQSNTLGMWIAREEIDQVCLFNPVTMQVESLAEHFPNAPILAQKTFTHAIKNDAGIIVLGTVEGELIQISGSEVEVCQTGVEDRVIPVFSLRKNHVLMIGYSQLQGLHGLEMIGKGNIQATELPTPTSHVADPMHPECYWRRKANKKYHYCHPGKFYRELVLKFPYGYRSPVDDLLFPLKNSEKILILRDDSLMVFDRIRPDTLYYRSVIKLKILDEPWANHFNPEVYGGQHGLIIPKIRFNPFKQVLYRPDMGVSNEIFSANGIMVWDSLVYMQALYYPLMVFNSHAGTIRDGMPWMRWSAKGDKRFKEGIDLLMHKNKLFALYEDKLAIVNPANQEALEVLHPGHSNVKLMCMYLDSLGQIWVGGNGGQVYQWKGEGSSLERFSFSGPQIDLAAEVSDFLMLNPHQLLIGTSKGVYELDLNKGSLSSYGEDESAPFQLPCFNVTGFYRAQDGIIWISTFNDGLIRWSFEKPGKPWRQFRMNEGLSSNTVYSVYEDNLQRLWLPSAQGLMCFDKNTFRCWAFQEKDGINHYDFNRHSDEKGPDGTLYFGGRNGVLYFHPDSIQLDLQPKGRLCISSLLQFDGKSQQLWDRTKKYDQEGNIILSPGDNFFSVRFAMLGNENPQDLHYAYKLEGQDKDWNTNVGHTVRFSGLDYGKYSLRIRVQEQNGPLSDQELLVPIQVIRPVYLRWWFIGICLGGALLCIIYLVRRRIQTIERRQEELEEIVRKRTATIQEQTIALQKLDKAKSRFFANISHELRTPLSLILGPLRSLLGTTEHSKKNREFLTIAEKNAQNLLGLVSEIMDLGKLDAGKLELKEEEVEIQDLMERLVGNFESQAELQHIQLKLDSKLDAPRHLLLDEPKFTRIINNLLSNALKFTPSEGAITLRLHELPELIRLEIQDTGPGIPKEALSKVFERYFQHASLNQPIQGGTGVGLALSWEISNLMEGKLWAESDGQNGATFILEFPKKLVLGENVKQELDSHFSGEAEEIETQKDLTTQELQTEKPGDKHKLLVVEDNQSLRRYLKLILEPHFEIFLAENGKKGWEALQNKEQTFDLVISDIMMPVMDGYQFVTNLKKSPEFHHLPAIMLTARSDIRDKIKALRIGVDDYILKPFEAEELIVRIRNLIQNSRARYAAHSDPDASEQAEQQIPLLSLEDAQWLEKVEEKVNGSISSFNFGAEELSYDLGMVRQTLNRRLKKLTGLTTSQYFQEAKLLHARGLLERREVSSVKAASLSIGIKDYRYFSTKFKERFGKLPSSYLYR